MRLNVHASCVAIGKAGEPFGAPPDAGVLLVGKSGAGKSDLCLRLIGGGAVFVSDDRTELFLRDGVLHACAVAALKGLLEIRNLGIVELPCAAQARIVLAVALEPHAPAARLPDMEWYDPPSGLGLPQNARPRLLRLDGSAPSAPAKVAAAVAAVVPAQFRDERQLAGPSFYAEDHHLPPGFRNTQ